MSGTARLRHLREFMQKMYPAFSRRATQVCILSSALEKIALGIEAPHAVALSALNEADAFGWKRRWELRAAGAAGPAGDPDVMPPPLPETVPIEEYRRVVARCIDLGERVAAVVPGTRAEGGDDGASRLRFDVLQEIAQTFGLDYNAVCRCANAYLAGVTACVWPHCECKGLLEPPKPGECQHKVGAFGVKEDSRG